MTRLVQYGPPDNLNTLTQQFGQAAQSPNINAIVILLVPKDYFKEVCHWQEERARKAAESRKQKADAENKGSDE